MNQIVTQDEPQRSPARRQPSPKGSRPYVLESAEYGAQLRSTKADIEAQLSILEGEAAGIAHRIADLTRILNSVNAGLVPIEEPGGLSE